MTKVNGSYLAKLVATVSVTAASFGISLVSTDELAAFYDHENQYDDKKTVM